jgi:hypothetical protein
MTDGQTQGNHFEYSLNEAIKDGLLGYVCDGVMVRDTVKNSMESTSLMSLAQHFRRLYDAGIYADPPSADPGPDGKEGLPCGKDFAIYRVDGVEYWVQPSGYVKGLLVGFFPRDY